MNEGLIERYGRDGYVVMEDLVSRSEVTELREEAEKLCLEKGAALARDCGRYVERPARGLSRHSFSSQAVEPVSQRARAPADRRDADVSDRPQCQMHAVDVVHQACWQAGAGLASGRVFHSNAGPLLDSGLDRSRRRNDRQRLPVGDPRLPPFGCALAAAPTCQSRVRLRSRNPSIFRTKRAMRGQSRSRWGRLSSSTAICCTDR